MKTKQIIFFIIILASALRLFHLDTIPPSLYTDEANQGWNAYSILQTGRDEHGVFLPVSLRSFGDWKPPLQTYLMIPFFALGFSPEYSIRLPGAVLGIGTILVTFLLVYELFRGTKVKHKFSLIAALLLTISPWHVLQSRTAMLVMVALFFFELGILAWLKRKQNGAYFIVAFLSFGLSIYAYYGMRLLVPLMLLFLLWYSLDFIKRNYTYVIWGGLSFLVLLLPLGISFLTQPDVLFGRAKTVSVFYDEGIKLRQWELIAQDGIGADTTITRFFHNQYYLYSRDVLRRFLSHIDGNYLFFTGDTAPPFQIPNMGILYPADGLFIFVGIIALISGFRTQRGLILFWFLISFVPASLTFMTPSSNRTFSAVVPFAIFSAVGIYFITSIHFMSAKIRFTLLFSISILYSLSFYYFLTQYLLILPATHAQWWNYGWKETVEYVHSIEDRYHSVVVFERNGMPYIYFLLYGGVDPVFYQEHAVRTYVPDAFGFEHVDSFGKFFFPDDRAWEDVKADLQPDTLYVVSAKQAEDDDDFQKAIYAPDGTILYKIFQK